MPVYLEQTVLDLPDIDLNGGSRGFLVGISAQAVVDLLQPELVAVAITS